VIRKLVRKALLAGPIQARLSGCVDVGGGFGGGDAPWRAPRGQPASLVLELELLGGEVRIADARVRAWGGASQHAVSCARAVLRGLAIGAAAAGPARRVEMPFPFNPRSEPLAVAR
jgi:hypothetical protein